MKLIFSLIYLYFVFVITFILFRFSAFMNELAGQEILNDVVITFKNYYVANIFELCIRMFSFSTRNILHLIRIQQCLCAFGHYLTYLSTP